MEEADRPSLDHDTKDVAGSPEIVTTILKKIQNAAVFVGDITPIVVSPNGKHVPNPNVLIELGFAKHALGPERIILVWNCALTDCSFEHLPFDLRHRRGPVTIDLPIGAGKAQLREARGSLVTEFEKRLRSCLQQSEVKAAESPSWQPSRDGDPSIWSTGQARLDINRRNDEPISVGFEAGPRAYGRIIPAFWDKSQNAYSKLGGDLHPIPLGKYGGLDWGRTTGGFIALRSSDTILSQSCTPTATRWFQENGELWGIASTFFTKRDQGYFYFEYDAIDRWLSWLRRSILICKSTGGQSPFFCKLGVSGMKGALWPKSDWVHGNPNVCVEDHIELDFVLGGSDNDAIVPAVRQMNNEIRESFGLDPLDTEEFEEKFRNGPYS